MKAVKKIISALPWILSIAAIIAAVVVAGYTYTVKANNDKEIAELEANNVSLESTISSLRGKLDSKLSSDSQNGQMEDKAKELERLIDAMPDDDPNAVDIIAKNLFDIGSDLIDYMGDAEFWAHNFIEPEIEVTKNGFTYSKCDISYSDAERFYSGIFVEKALEDFMSIRFTDVDGDLYAIPGGGSSGYGMINVKLTRDYETKDEIKYNISYIHTFNGGFEDSGTCSMTIKLVNGGWRISEIDYMEGYWLIEELYWRTHTE